MANENRFDTMFKTSFENIKGMLDSNTIVGSPIELSNGSTIIPISKLSVGFATGGVDTGDMPAEKKTAKFLGRKKFQYCWEPAYCILSEDLE